MSSHIHVIVFQKHHFPKKLVALGHFHDALNILLATVITGVGLSRKDQLNRELGVIKERHSLCQIAENKRGPFVTGEPARESNGESIGRQNLFKNPGSIAPGSLKLFAQTLSDELEQFASQEITQGPHFFV